MSSVPYNDVENGAGENDALLAGRGAANQKPSIRTNITNFTKGTVQAAFIQKVYGLLSIQLLLTVFMSCLFMFVEPIRNFITAPENIGLYYFSALLPLVFIIILFCCKPKYPWNFVCLIGLTICFSYSLGTISAFYYKMGAGVLILEAFILTSAIFGSLTAYALITKKDFSFLGGFLFASLFILILWGFIQMFFPMGSIVHAIYCLIGAIIFCLFILFDTSRLIHHYTPDQYIEATVELYLDFINLFLFILQLLSGGRGD